MPWQVGPSFHLIQLPTYYISASKPHPDGGKLDEGEIARGQLLVADGNPPVLLEPADEALNHVALAVEHPIKEPRALLRPELWDDSADPATPEIVS